MDSTTATPKFIIAKEVISVVKNIVLDGVSALKAEKFTTTFEIKRELYQKDNQQQSKLIYRHKLGEIVEPMSFNLVEVTSKELSVYRKSGISSFVLKVDGKLYYTSIPDNISFVSSPILGAHRCAVVGHECKRLSAASDEHGGCEKVRNRSTHIENYPWITTGYETFNTNHDSFVVVNCLHYVPIPPRKKLPVDKAINAKLGLAQFYWDDITSREKVEERIKEALFRQKEADKKVKKQKEIAKMQKEAAKRAKAYYKKNNLVY